MTIPPGLTREIAFSAQWSLASPSTRQKSKLSKGKLSANLEYSWASSQRWYSTFFKPLALSSVLIRPYQSGLCSTLTRLLTLSANQIVLRPDPHSIPRSTGFNQLYFHHRASKPGRTRTPALINHQAQSVVDVTWCPVPKLAQWGLASNRIIHKSSRGPHFVTASCPRQIGPYRCRRYRTRKGPSADASGTFPGFL